MGARLILGIDEGGTQRKTLKALVKHQSRCKGADGAGAG